MRAIVGERKRGIVAEWGDGCWGEALAPNDTTYVLLVPQGATTMKHDGYGASQCDPVIARRNALVNVHPCIYIAQRHVYSTSMYIHGRSGMMQTTKAFRNGNSQAVRIPAELAFDRTDIELEIERVGDELRIRPARRPLGGVLKKFAKFAPEFMTEDRGEQEQAEREAL
jgi:antitoxin VapB